MPSNYDNGQPAYGCWNPAHFTIRDAKAPDDSDTRKAKRIDIEYNIGDHTIRAGYDAQDFISTNAGSTYSGGIYYRYYETPASGTINGVANAGVPGTQYVRVRKLPNDIRFLHGHERCFVYRRQLEDTPRT